MKVVTVTVEIEVPDTATNQDTERAAALGYFMAGAELQCFGEFVKYEDLCSDE